MKESYYPSSKQMTCYRDGCDKIEYARLRVHGKLIPICFKEYTDNYKEAFGKRGKLERCFRIDGVWYKVSNIWKVGEYRTRETERHNNYNHYGRKRKTINV